MAQAELSLTSPDSSSLEYESKAPVAMTKGADEERRRDRFDLSPVLKGPKSENRAPALSFNISDFTRSRAGKWVYRKPQCVLVPAAP